MPQWWVDKIQSEWRIVFIITASVLVFGGDGYLVLGSGVRQAWDKNEEQAVPDADPSTDKSLVSHSSEHDGGTYNSHVNKESAKHKE